MKSFIQYLHEIKSISNVPVAAKPTEPGMMSQIALQVLPVLAMTAISSRFGRGPAAAAGAETATKAVKSSKLVT